MMRTKNTASPHHEDYRPLAAAALLLMGLVMASAALAQPGPGSGPRGFHGPRQLVEALVLTEEQQEAWKAAHEAHREQLKPLLEEQQDLQKRIQESLESGAADPTQIGEWTVARYESRQEVEALQQQFQTDLESILTEEQRQQFAELRQHRGPGGPGRGGRGPRGRGGFGPRN